MFYTILKKLTIRNSLVFLVIFIIFTAIVHSYVAYTLFDKIDDAMQYRVNSLKIVNGRVTFTGKYRTVYDPRIYVLLRGEDNRIINLYPIKIEELSDAVAAAAKINPGELSTVEYRDHYFRIFNLPYSGEEQILFTENELIKINEVIAVSIVDSEIALINNLLKIFLAGLIIGTTIIFLAGYYLARHALVPIRASWEKQNQFVADASHELRSPLTVIQSNAELILRHPDHTVEKESKRVTNILREAMRMTKLVSTLLTLARADANKIELQLTLTSLNDMVDDISEQFTPLAELKGISFKVDINENIEFIADKERLHQLLVIVLDNAIKYTASSGYISLICYVKNNNVNIKVEDTGCGIPAEDLPRIFDRFFRGDKSRSRESGGTGLGLAIAKWIVDKHNGKIRVDSQVGIGTQFHIILPLRR